jgi:uncharacterized membrane protein
VSSVRILDELRSEWTALGPGDARIRWRSEVVDDRPNELISWRSIDHSPIEQRGSVRFVPAPGDEGTEVHLELEYGPPPGTVGILVGRLLVGLTGEKMQEDLRNLKRLYETGTIPTTDGQPAGKRGTMGRLKERIKQLPRRKETKRALRGEVQA